MAAEDYFDPYEYGDCDEELPVTCNRCGAPDLEWARDGDRWVLLNVDGKVHQCDLSSPKRLAKIFGN